jgi:acetylornithine deacetylase/succinyl-diaminopimelate desuccinylase-like protein
MTEDRDPAVVDHLSGRLDRWSGDLADWVRIASVSAEPERRPEVTRSAHWLAAHLRGTGFPEVELWPTDGLPAVYGCWPAEDPGAPRVLVYSHHDVRAAQAPEWQQTAPFRPELREGRLHGRGSSDAKGQLLCVLWALRTHLAVAGATAPAVSVALLVEGEEEVGSPNLPGLLAAHRERLAADVAVVTDTMLFSLDEAAVCTAARGMVSAHLEITGPRREVHSGLAAGTAADPLTELCRLIGSLHDGRGRITVPGFYDDVVDLSAEQRAELARLPFDPADWYARTGLPPDIGGEEGYSVLERLWTRPAIEVATLLGGAPGEPARGVVPAVASADLTIHLVPEQTPDAAVGQLRRWVARRLRDGFGHQLDSPPFTAFPYVTPAGHPALATLERAMSRTLQRPPLRMRNGGATPADMIARALDVPVLFFGTGLPEDRWHAADERADLRALRQGAETFAYFLADLPGSLPRRAGTVRR